MSLEPRTPEGERLLDRRGFLRQVGLTALAAVGFAGASAVMARDAQAAGTFCEVTGCRNCTTRDGRTGNSYSCYNACYRRRFSACYARSCSNFQSLC